MTEDPMDTLYKDMRRISRSGEANNARIRAALVKAMMNGADKDEIERMARAVGLHDVEQDTD